MQIDNRKSPGTSGSHMENPEKRVSAPGFFVALMVVVAFLLAWLVTPARGQVTSGPSGGSGGGGTSTNAVSTETFNGGAALSNAIAFNLNNANAVTSGVSVVQSGQTVTYTMHNNTNVAGLTNNNAFLGASNSVAGNFLVTSNCVVKGAVNANSLIVTNGMTNQALTGNTLLWADSNKTIQSVTSLVNLSFDSGTLTASAGGGTGQATNLALTWPIANSNGGFQGVTLNFTNNAGRTLTNGDVVYFTNGLALADCSGSGTFPAGGVVLTTATTGSSTTVLISGLMANAGWSWTQGQALWLSTSGHLTQTKPTTTGQQQQYLGVALDTTNILFRPSPDYFTAP